ncbi:hypothetical protein WX98_14270, partial [Pseudomonas syringae pv. persicae]|uniref:hypothetical protein n=1 Tax=Pseudomonas syringae group genomosp. 3 TaxID=251701 RepID=UPI000620E9BC
PPISKRRAEICPRNAKQGRQVEKNRLGNEDGANGLIFQRLLKPFQSVEDETLFKRMGVDVSKAHETKGVSTKVFKY